MLNQTDSGNSSTNSLSQLVQNMFSDNNNNIMLAAIVSLLLVILFVLLLHVYAKWFLAHAELQSRARRRRTPVTISGVPFPSNFHHINIEPAPFSTKGLDSTTVSMIPTFVCEAITEAEKEELECVICLSDIEKGEIGRRLPKCGHAFHVECIDMWLSSHCNCPICRASIFENDSQFCLGGGGGGGGGDDGGVVEIVIGGSENNGGGGVSGSVSVSETSLSLLKRMLSKVFVSSHNNVNELDGSQ